MKKIYRNLLIGASRTLILFPEKSIPQVKLYQPSPSIIEALKGDWEKIGKDFQVAIEQAENVETSTI